MKELEKPTESCAGIVTDDLHDVRVYLNQTMPAPQARESAMQVIEHCSAALGTVRDPKLVEMRNNLFSNVVRQLIELFEAWNALEDAVRADQEAHARPVC